MCTSRYPQQRHNSGRSPQVDVQTSTTGPARSLTIDEKGIAWKSDVSKKFGDQKIANFNVNPSARGGGTATGGMPYRCIRT